MTFFIFISNNSLYAASRHSQSLISQITLKSLDERIVTKISLSSKDIQTYVSCEYEIEKNEFCKVLMKQLNVPSLQVSKLRFVMSNGGLGSAIILSNLDVNPW